MSPTSCPTHPPTALVSIRTAFLIVLAIALRVPAAESGRPNVLLIVADDVAALDHGCYGNRVVRTPNIDRLAEQGMRFANMFTPSTTCVPSRTSLYTGLYPIRHGAHPNWSSVKLGTKSLPHYLSRLGYRVILLGKKHVLPAESFPFEHYADPGQQGPGRDFERILSDDDPRPWCIMMAKFGAHVAWPHNINGYAPAQVDIPDDHIDTPSTRRFRSYYYSKITEMDAAVGRVLDSLKEHDLEDNTLTIYTADHGTDWPKQKWNLYDAGMRTPFIARWPGRIEPGSSVDALCSYVDVVPTIIETAGGHPEEVVRSAGGESLDGRSFLPVLLGKRTGHHDVVFGCFTWGVMTAYPMRAVRTATHKYIWNIDSEYRFNWPPDTGWWGDGREPMALSRWSREYWPMWRSWFDRAKSDPAAAALLNRLQYRPPIELYDLRVDPDETHNLAEHPDQRKLMESLGRKLAAWMEQQGDDGSSAYHKEGRGKPRFLDQFYGRQHVVNVRAYAAGETQARVELSCPLWRATIHFTLDGSEPTPSSPRYTKPLVVTPTKTIMARAFDERIVTPVKTVDLPEINFRFHYQYHIKPWSW